MDPKKVACSILTADFNRLGEEIQAAEKAGVDWLHLDVMDGQFVPNLTIGPLVLRSIKRITQLPCDVHLMIETPERLIPEFASAGADHITVHVETCPHLHRTLEQIKDFNLRAGVAVNPATPLASIEEVLWMADMVLLMSVNPGFGGQTYIPTSTAKIRRLHQTLVERGLTETEIVVDGGIKDYNIAQVASAGASVMVVGSGIYNARASVMENVRALRLALG